MTWIDVLEAFGEVGFGIGIAVLLLAALGCLVSLTALLALIVRKAFYSLLGYTVRRLRRDFAAGKLS